MKPRFVEDMILVMILLQVFRGSNRILAVYTWRMEDARLIHRELYLGSGHYFLVKRGDWNLRLWNKVLFVSIRVDLPMEICHAKGSRDIEN